MERSPLENGTGSFAEDDLDLSLDLDSNTDEGSLVFRATDRLGWKVIALLGNGAMFTVLFIGGIVWLFAHPGRGGGGIMPGVLGGLAVIPIFSFITAFILMRCAQRVELDRDAVSIFGFGWSRRFAYREIGKIDNQIKAMATGGANSSVTTLVLYNDRNKEIACIPSKMRDFALLRELLIERVEAASGKKVYDLAAELEEKRRKRGKQQFWLPLCFGGFSLLMTLGIGMGVHEYRQSQQLLESGVTADARLVRHYKHNGRFPRIEYAIDIGDREYTRNILVEEKTWNLLEGRETLPVRYLSNKPSYSRLVQGETDEFGNGLPMIGICFLGLCLFGTMFVFTLLGYDLVTHEGKMYLLRRGEILEDKLR